MLAVGAVEKQLIGLTVVSGSTPLGMVEAQPSDIRLAFCTAATVMELDVLHTKTVYQGLPRRARRTRRRVYDLLIDGCLAGRASTPEGNTGLSSQPKNIEIWLPQAEITEPIALRTVAPVEAPAPSGRNAIRHVYERAGVPRPGRWRLRSPRHTSAQSPSADRSI